MTTFTIILALLAPQPTTSAKPTPASPVVKVVKAQSCGCDCPPTPLCPDLPCCEPSKAVKKK